jgi:hypothetical protein
MSFKLESNLRPFDGTGSWTLWFDRFETIASFSKWEDDQDKARYLSVYLEGTALRIFQQLPEASRRSCKAVAQRLREAFQPSAQESHALLLKRKWQQGQSVEELYYDQLSLWKCSLGSLAEKLGEDAQTAAVVPFFYAALPSEISRQLRLLEIPLHNADQLLRHARTLVGCFSETEAEAINAVGGQYHNPGRKGKGGSGKKFKIVCKNCRGPHREEQCKYSEPVCIKCFKPGHFSKDCRSKNESGAGRSSGPA